ncbi:MAG: zinc ribbon domain-containing protein [Candidatus Bathyarchaeota archaeon]|nr:zinc ribbon domain-containing protein [Candidatus Bathyarchaeum sp.]
MNCPSCDNEIVDEDANCCPKCGQSFAPEEETEQNVMNNQQRTDLVLAAAILTIVGAAFSASVGYMGIYQYTYYVDYIDFSLLAGFLILAAVGFIVSAFAITGGVFMLKRKYIKISMLGIVLLLASVVANYVIIQHYQYGFTDITLMSEISVLIFSVLSGVFVATSKAEFT